MTRIKMAGYEMEIDYGSHVRNRLRTRFDDVDTEYLEYRIECICEHCDVADYLMNEVKVGEDVVVIDEDSGITFALSINTDLIYIKTVYNAYEQSTLLFGDKQKILRFAERLGLRYEVFERRRAYA